MQQNVLASSAQYQNMNDGKPSTTFVPSSNLSTFLLTKGSSDSLNTFDNEYSYRINLENIGLGQQPQSLFGGQQMHALQKKGKHLPQNQNQIFSEVIIEDDDEQEHYGNDHHSSQGGSNSNTLQNMGYG